MLIGLGHPRCGTGFTASLLQANGVAVKHEDVGPEGIVSWMQVAKRGPAPWGNTLNEYPSGARVFLVARSPLAALDAVATENQQIRSIGLRSQLTGLVGRPIARAGRHVWQNAYGPHKKSGRLSFAASELGRVGRPHLGKLIEITERLGYPADAATMRGYL